MGRGRFTEKCPKAPVHSDGDTIAPYWMQFTSGAVTVQQLKGVSDLGSSDEGKRMVEEINAAFKGDIDDEDNIKGILLITWKNMRNQKNEKRSELVRMFCFGFYFSGWKKGISYGKLLK